MYSQEYRRPFSRTYEYGDENYYYTEEPPQQFEAFDYPPRPYDNFFQTHIWRPHTGWQPAPKNLIWKPYIGWHQPHDDNSTQQLDTYEVEEDPPLSIKEMVAKMFKDLENLKALNQVTASRDIHPLSRDSHIQNVAEQEIFTASRDTLPLSRDSLPEALPIVPESRNSPPPNRDSTKDSSRVVQKEADQVQEHVDKPIYELPLSCPIKSTPNFDKCQYRKFFQLVIQLNAKLPSVKSLGQMSRYALFHHELLTNLEKWKDGISNSYNSYMSNNMEELKGGNLKSCNSYTSGLKEEFYLKELLRMDDRPWFIDIAIT